MSECCSICYNNVTAHSKITCPFCEYVGCKTCIQRYSLESTEDLNCVNCHRYFDRSTQAQMFTKNFIDKVYKKRREEVLFQRECSLLPSTQPAIIVEKHKRNVRTEIQNTRELYNNKMKELNKLNKKIQDLNVYLYSNNINSQDAEDMKSASAFVMKCSRPECKGFMSTAYKCGTCSEYTCPDCHEPKNGRNDLSHVCDENKVKTIALISRDCKPCVSCGTQIHKIEGCPQMFCTQCNILFDWNTGKKVSHTTGHNPHFIQWLRDNGRNARNVGDVMCGGVPNISYIVRKMNQPYGSKSVHTISTIVRILLHIHHYERVLYPIEWNNDQESENLRVKWSLGDMTDDEFKTTRQKMEKKKLLNKEIGLVLEMLINSSTDVLQRFVNDENSTECLYDTEIRMFEELEGIRVLVNSNFRRISKDFSNKTPIISEKWDYIGKYV